MPERSVSLVPVFAAANLCFAVLGLLGILFWSVVLVFGFLLSEESGEDLVDGVVGCGLFIAVCLVATPLYAVAGVGLIRRAPWGYYCHLVGAILAVFSCLGVIYTVFALVFGLRPEFQEEFFRRRLRDRETEYEY
jgi:hypothetical protein